MEIEKYIIADDQSLVRMSLEGDTAAFEQLFNRYRDSIYQLYLLRTGIGRDDADDILQEIFIKVYLKLHRYNAEYTFGQWIYTIARNTFIDYVRKKREDIPLDTFSEGYPSGSPSSAIPTPEESFISSQQKAQLEHHLGKMTPRYRKLIELRFFRDLSYEEIAAELNIPMGTVKTQIHRAREQLCRSITEHSDILP
ncbi:MAG: sigma-70 family RNA polymerase sigma factor [Rikenellaceae bacterium]|nr:sigma-70 family RNA polymerase sigma factor [Rikenellaceae bacterium]